MKTKPKEFRIDAPIPLFRSGRSLGGTVLIRRGLWLWRRPDGLVPSGTLPIPEGRAGIRPNPVALDQKRNLRANWIWRGANVLRIVPNAALVMSVVGGWKFVWFN